MHYVILILLALLGIGAVAVTLAIWNQVRDTLAAWLRKMGLHKSKLMDAIIFFDNIAGKVRSRLFATTRRTGKVLIEETTYEINQIDDRKVLAELRKRGHADRSVRHLVK
jgi:hypothetical protein